MMISLSAINRLSRNYQTRHDVPRLAASALLIILIISSLSQFVVVSAFQPPSTRIRSTPVLVTYKSTPRTASTSTSLHAFWFFGGSGDKGKKRNKKQNSIDDVDGIVTDDDNVMSSSKSAAVLPTGASGVKDVMNSLQSYQTSQRVAKVTSTTLQDLSNIVVEGSSSDGKVKVMYSGKQTPVGVQIDESYFKSLQATKDGATELSLAITQAMKDAHIKSAGKIDDKLKSLYNDLGFDTTLNE